MAVTQQSGPWQPGLQDPTEFDLGCEVHCSDGRCGRLARVVLDPDVGSITHLIVHTEHNRGGARLVPASLVESTTGGVWLRCDRDAFAELPEPQAQQYVFDDEKSWADPDTAVESEPFYWISAPGMPGMGGMRVRPRPWPVTVENVPTGGIEIGKHERVHASDGAVGHCCGLVVDPTHERVTHVLLAGGHLRGRRRVAIPMASVARVDGAVHLTLTQDEVRALPPVDALA